MCSSLLRRRNTSNDCRGAEQLSHCGSGSCSLRTAIDSDCFFSSSECNRILVWSIHDGDCLLLVCWAAPYHLGEHWPCARVREDSVQVLQVRHCFSGSYWMWLPSADTKHQFLCRQATADTNPSAGVSGLPSSHNSVATSLPLSRACLVSPHHYHKSLQL